LADDVLWRLRIEAFPRFLQRAAENLQGIPVLFQSLGLNMTQKLKRWMHSIVISGRFSGAAVSALERFEARLTGMPTRLDLCIDPDFFKRVAARHIGCEMDPDRISDHLMQEIDDTRRQMAAESVRLTTSSDWRAAVDQMTPENSADPFHHYRRVIGRLGQHCMEKGLVDSDVLESCPIAVEPVPGHLTPVRSAAAYSMPPGHPPRGGVFYISHIDGSASLPADWRLLAAHETYPGHHLLDTYRWRLARPIRRHIEFPIYYEGWASFAEELLFDTGFFSGPADRLLMAKRRFWRAMRGKVDLDMQMRWKTLPEAAEFLSRAGMEARRAEAMVQRYALKPGYQLCYSIGRIRFRDLYERFLAAGHSPVAFARRAVAEGEIGLDNLEINLFENHFLTTDNNH
jgi:uncharacterized protein (DUF885 family)